VAVATPSCVAQLFLHQQVRACCGIEVRLPPAASLDSQSGRAASWAADYSRAAGDKAEAPSWLLPTRQALQPRAFRRISPTSPLQHPPQTFALGRMQGAQPRMSGLQAPAELPPAAGVHVAGTLLPRLIDLEVMADHWVRAGWFSGDVPSGSIESAAAVRCVGCFFCNEGSVSHWTALPRFHQNVKTTLATFDAC
jgi:hypothetical protein